MTFGGAYAVLPYVYQGAVTHHGWLTAGQMMDGLALGESTLGPLIMAVTFLGFVGGHTKAVLGVDDVPLGGIGAACLVTWFTFCPRLFFYLRRRAVA
ncbi:chromate transporter [Klebsiella pneumoniae]|nr:chromate transporter [Klebsiella pneumoniae]